MTATGQVTGITQKSNAHTAIENIFSSSFIVSKRLVAGQGFEPRYPAYETGAICQTAPPAFQIVVTHNTPSRKLLRLSSCLIIRRE